MLVDAHKVAQILGGSSALGRDVRTELELADAVRAGLPIVIVDAMGRVFSPEELNEIVPKSTRSRRRAVGRLTPEQSDRMERHARAYASAEAVFKSPEKAADWLRRPNRALGHRRPIDLLVTDAGVRAVETILMRIEHGIYS